MERPGASEGSASSWGRAGALAAIAGLICLGAAGLVSRPVIATAGTTQTGISVECGPDGTLAGTITGIPGPYPVGFSIFVTDHIPGESDFVEIPGSRIDVVANSDTLGYGPLDTSQHRAGINTMRVETTLSNEKSRSLLCIANSTVTVVATTSPQGTPQRTVTVPPQTPSAVATSTPTPVQTSTSTPVSSTTTPGSSTNTPVSSSNSSSTPGSSSTSPSSQPTFVNTVLSSEAPGDVPQSGIVLPGTGSGGQRGTWTMRLFVSLAAFLAGAGSWGVWQAVSTRRR